MSILSPTALLVGVVSFGTLLSGCVELKQAGRTVGHTSRDVAKDVGHASRDVAKDISRGAARVLSEAAQADCAPDQTKNDSC